ncbi:hypothetical protein N799_08625 [Lysobacter arseniciresistens ZS79]|uniref:Uncharacterized protein n=1 Tax=Lysobacter arseniciresistens ZS79 TaxID=913325 RepID=A0A0A0EV52_9GAMM|nr:hypothetical protein [Lysobacter arseniciresistens]KGM54806.1 hypothetical protein N799_08625 [Lysobacter arseniciresistens ZS79]
MSKVRKGFDIEKADLDEAKARADAMGISLFRYLQLAVKEKNEGAGSLDLLQAMEDRLLKQLDRMRSDMDRLRVELRDDNDAMSEQLREQNQQFLLTTHSQLQGFIGMLGETLGPDTPWSPDNSGIPDTY